MPTNLNAFLIVCYHYQENLHKSVHNKCYEYQKPVHAQCAIWVFDERKSTAALKVPVCLVCNYSTNSNLQDENFYEKATRNVKTLYDHDRHERLGLTNKASSDKVDPSDLKVSLGPMNDIDKFNKHSVESNAAFRDKAKHLPRIGPEEFHCFINPPKEVWKKNYKPSKIFISTSAHLYAPILGPHLRRDTFLNDSIMQQCAML